MKDKSICIFIFIHSIGKIGEVDCLNYEKLYLITFILVYLTFSWKVECWLVQQPRFTTNELEGGGGRILTGLYLKRKVMFLYVRPFVCKILINHLFQHKPAYDFFLYAKNSRGLHIINHIYEAENKYSSPLHISGGFF